MNEELKKFIKRAKTIEFDGYTICNNKVHTKIKVDNQNQIVYSGVVPLGDMIDIESELDTIREMYDEKRTKLLNRYNNQAIVNYYLGIEINELLEACERLGTKITLDPTGLLGRQQQLADIDINIVKHATFAQWKVILDYLWKRKDVVVLEWLKNRDATISRDFLTRFKDLIKRKDLSVFNRKEAFQILDDCLY